MAYAGALLDRTGLTLPTCLAALPPALHRAAALNCPLLLLLLPFTAHCCCCPLSTAAAAHFPLLLLLLRADHRPPLLPSAHCCPHTHLLLPQTAASKGALLPLSRSLASAWGKDNIQVCRGSLQPLWKSCARWNMVLDFTRACPHLAPLPCQVNTLLPGAINTPFLNTMLANPRKLEYILGRIPLGALR